MRTMPPKGFYVYHGGDTTLTAKGYKEIIYTTGERGGGNHKYCRCMGNVVMGGDNRLEWATLLWSCVPSVEELQANYTFYPTWEAVPSSFGFPVPPPDKVKALKTVKPPHQTKIRKEDVLMSIRNRSTGGEGLRVVIVDVMKGLSNYGFFFQSDVSGLVNNLNKQQDGVDDPTILKNGQHLVVIDMRGRNVIVRCEETGAQGEIFLCDLTQKCQKTA